jgi:Uma2 family endonuclease
MVQAPIEPQLFYPDSDGKPMADNTVQYRWIVRLVANLRYLFKEQTVFVAGDLLWYPQQVTVPPAPRQAPDAMVVFGRPPGERGSYKQWEEDNIAPQVVFEILSPSNSAREMLKKQSFYREHGVLEMFFYDPDSHDFWGLVRANQQEDFFPVTALNFPWTSPILGIRFEMFEEGLEVFYPDGERFKDPETLFEERNQAQQERNQAQQERNQAQQERNQAQQERDRAFARLRELGIDPTQL